MDRDDEEPQLPGTRPLDRLLPYLGTYTPPPPYRVFKLISGSANPVEPIGTDDSDRYDCLTIRLRRSPRLRLVEKADTLELNVELADNLLKF